MGGLSDDRGRRGEIQRMLTVVSGVLATDQVLKWWAASNAGMNRSLSVVPWVAAVSIAALALSTVALLIMLDARLISVTVAGLMLGALSSVVIDVFADTTPHLATTVADLAVIAAVGWWGMATIMNRLMWREPVVHHNRQRLAA